MYEFVCTVLREIAALGILPAHLTNEPLAPDTSLLNLGIDSLGSMSLLSEISGRLSLPMLEIDLNQNVTLGEIAAFLEDLQLVQPEQSHLA